MMKQYAFSLLVATRMAVTRRGMCLRSFKVFGSSCLSGISTIALSSKTLFFLVFSSCESEGHTTY